MQTQTRQQRAVPVVCEKLITRTNSDFTDGLCSGYLTYFSDHEGKSLTDQDVYDFLFANLSDNRGTVLFNAGYCVGFVEAFIEDRNLFAKE